MAKQIWKYTIEVADRFTLEMPEGAEMLTVQMQHGQPRLWALVDVNARLVTHNFAVVGTGHDFNAIAGRDSYLGAFQVPPYVWHLWQVDQ